MFLDRAKIIYNIFCNTPKSRGFGTNMNIYKTNLFYPKLLSAEAGPPLENTCNICIAKTTSKFRHVFNSATIGNNRVNEFISEVLFFIRACHISPDSFSPTQGIGVRPWIISSRLILAFTRQQCESYPIWQYNELIGQDLTPIAPQNAPKTNKVYSTSQPPVKYL